MPYTEAQEAGFKKQLAVRWKNQTLVPLLTSMALMLFAMPFFDDFGRRFVAVAAVYVPCWLVRSFYNWRNPDCGKRHGLDPRSPDKGRNCGVALS